MCAFSGESFNQLILFDRLIIFLIIKLIMRGDKIVLAEYESMRSIDAIENRMVHKIASVLTKGRERVRHRENLHVGFSSCSMHLFRIAKIFGGSSRNRLILSSSRILPVLEIYRRNVIDARHSSFFPREIKERKGEVSIKTRHFMKIHSTRDDLLYSRSHFVIQSILLG